MYHICWCCNQKEHIISCICGHLPCHHCRKKPADSDENGQATEYSYSVHHTEFEVEKPNEESGHGRTKDASVCVNGSLTLRGIHL